MPEMTPEELGALVRSEIQASLGYVGGQISEDRAEAMDRYLGKPNGKEIEGRSSVVDTAVFDTVEGVLPHLLKMFASGDQVVRFEPVGPEDEEAAKQATEYVNWIFTQDNRGYVILDTWFRDALVQKNGFTKVYWSVEDRWKTEKYFGMPDDAFGLLMAEVERGDVELVAHSETATPAGVMHDAIVRKAEESGRVKVCNVPPEHFLISPEAIDLQTARFVGHREFKTVSELVEMGYDRDQVERLAGERDSLSDTPEELSRRTEDEQTGASLSGPVNNKAMRQLEVVEAYQRVDYDGDGVAELRKIVCGGSGWEILKKNGEPDVEEWDGPRPFASLTPIPRPHQFFGIAIAEPIINVQEVKTALMRGMLDGVYLNLAPESEVVVGNLEEGGMEAILKTKPGNKIPVKVSGTVVPIPKQDTAPIALEAIQYMEEVRENRSGFNRYAQGTDADALNKTKGGIQILQNAAMERVLMIARTFAETGVRELFKLILHCAQKYQQQARVVRLRNKWVPMDPRQWSTGMDVSINVGLGTGNKDQQLGHAMALLQMDAEIIKFQGGLNGPILKASGIYKKLEKVIEAIGWKQIEPYYTDPEQPENQPPPPPPSPEQQKLELEREKTQGQLTLDAQKTQGELALKDKEIQLKELEIVLKEREMALREREMQINASLESAKIQDGQVARAEQRDHEVKTKRMEMEPHPDATEKVERIAQAAEQALGGVVQQIQQVTEAVGQLIARANAPRKLIKQGGKKFVQIGDEQPREIMRGPDGSMMMN